MNESFLQRIDELSALFEQCRDSGAFGSATFRDWSNRSNRDYQFWRIAVDCTEVSGSETQRKAAQLEVWEPAPDVPSTFKATWHAEIWRDSNTNNFNAGGSYTLPWEMPTAVELEEEIRTLLTKAQLALSNRSHPNS